MPRASTHFALSLWVLGLAFRLVGFMVAQPLISQAGFPMVMLGAMAVLFGWGRTLPYAFPVLFLMFSFGFVSDLMLTAFSGTLRYVGAGFAHDVIRTLIPGAGPFGLNQSMIITRVGAFDVVEACSGVRGITALFVLGSILGWRRRLSGWRAVGYTGILLVMSVIGNVVRIAVTLMTAILSQGRWPFETIHSIWNWIVFGGCILALPAVTSWVATCRPRFNITRILTVAVVCGYLMMVAARARESRVGVMTRGTGPDAQRTLVIQTPEVPSTYQSLVTRGSPDTYGWVLGSGLAHVNILHLLTNVIILFCLGEALSVSWGAWLPVLPVLAGQVAGSVTGNLIANSTPDARFPVFIGASGAAAGLLGGYLMTLLARRDRRSLLLAALLLGLFLAGILGSNAGLQPPYRLSVLAHVASLVAGCLSTAAVLVIARRRETAEKNRPILPDDSMGRSQETAN